jgi:integrase
MATIRKRVLRSEKTGEVTTTRWLVDYKDQSGKRRFQTFDTKREAEAARVRIEGEIAQGVHTPENTSITIAQAAELWIQRSELERLEISTLRQYRNHANLHIKPLIGGKKLAQISTPTVEAFRDELLKKSSRPMARKVLASLKSIITEAQRRGLVAHNAAVPVKVDVKKRESGKLAVGRDIPSKNEVQAILATAAGRWRPFFVTAVFTGMRASELRGLTWDNVDFDKKVVHVRQRANLWGDIGAPKSAAGDREIPMAPVVVNTLREWKLACPEGELGIVFPNGKGKIESHANIWNRGFSPLQIQAEVLGKDGKPKYGLHALRHFFASWAIERGFSAKKVQALLGHSSITMTYDRYGHLFPSLEDDHAKFAAGAAELVG